MLSNLQELLERSIFHAIRELTVAEGYTPDIANYNIEDNDINISQSESDLFEAAKVVIFNDKGFTIDIFGAGSNQTKGLKKAPRIVIDTKSFQPGTLGGDTIPVYELIDGTYVKSSEQSLASDFFYNIYAVAEDIKQLRILTAIISQALPRRGYIKTYIDSTIQPYGNILVRFLSSSNSDDLPEGILECIYSYESPDIFESLPQTIETQVGGNVFNIKPINDIQLQTLSTLI
jgi:hypothetical protein